MLLPPFIYMKLATTIVLLLSTIIVLPIIAINFDTPLTALQWEIVAQSYSVAFGVAMLCFILSEITENCSQVDKIWSITPVIFVWQFAAMTDWQPRLVLMAVLVTIWGIRLTYNFSRRGAYSWRFWSGEEDYRWEVLRQQPIFKDKPWNWRLFNFFFISIYQNSLIWMITLPAVVAVEGANKPLSFWDFLTAFCMLSFIVIETIADQQQWNFQTKKYALIKAGSPLTGDYAKGFLDKGLWGIVRHPNYASEQMIWVVFYCFSIVATGRVINWSVAGVLLLLLLFQGSADFSENISGEKYPAYKDYIKRVGRYIPKFW